MINKASLKKIFLSLLVVWGGLSGTPVTAQNNPAKMANTVVEMIPQFETVREGQSFWVGFSFIPDKDWHVYWRNPGDSGLAPKVEWLLPNDFTAGEIKWPQPHRIEAPPLVSFGYDRETFLLFEIKVPSSFGGLREVLLSAKVSWLACQVECIPGTAHFNISIPVTTDQSRLNQKYLETYGRFKIQYPFRDVVDAMSIQETRSDFVVRYKPSRFVDGVEAIRFFPYDTNIVDYTVAPKFMAADRSYTISIKKSSHYQEVRNGRFRGIFVFEKENLGSISPVEIDIPLKSTQTQKPIVMDKGFTGRMIIDIPLAVLFAFIGGLILNLMPCVLPVLTIKVLNLVEKSRKEKSALLNHGVQFTLGILVSFWVLAGIMLLFRFAGKQVGWGFQFQSPYFVVGMAILFFILALNLFGLFEIGTHLTRLRSTDFAFFNGVLATVVATPCTAPFMGTAMGFALAKPPVYTFLIFTSLGIGMAFPYMVLSCFPSLLRFVPKPGAWMLYLKQFFGFVLMAVVIWLSWVLSIQKGGEAVIILLGGLFLIALGIWLHSVANNVKGMVVVTFLVCVAGFYASVQAAKSPAIHAAKASLTKESGIQWEGFDQLKLERYLSDNRAVFLDFTAAWCLTCQVNERTVFYNQKVIDRFNELGIIPIKADWTNYDPKITQILNSYGKNSIPVYIFYPRGRQSQPVILPELITPDIVIQALDKYVIE